VDDVAIYAGLVQDADGNYYYINSSKKAVKNTGYNIGEAKANGLLPAGRYYFDAEGKMITE
jgi:glucan-binding YG repeat protein